MYIDGMTLLVMDVNWIEKSRSRNVNGQRLPGLTFFYPKHIRIKGQRVLGKTRGMCKCKRTMNRGTVWLDRLRYRKFPKYSDTPKNCCNHS